MTKSEAQVLADKVNLTESDMPGFHASPPDATQTLGADRNFTRCSHTVPSSKSVADIPSQTFERDSAGGYQSILSDVTVLQSADLVARDLKALRTSRARKCLAKALRKESGKALRKVTVKPLRPGVPNGAGLRMKMVIRVQDQNVPVFIDVLVVGHEDVEAGIIVAGGPFAPPRAQEDDLLQIVEQRLVTEQNKDTIL